MVGPLPYVGGKNRIAKRIIQLFPKHQTYVEPFAGGAQIFFHKEPSAVEVLNDLDGEIVNFFRICQHHHDELVRSLRFSLASRQWFTLLRRLPPESLTDLQRAARFFYLQKNAFAGLRRNQNFHYCVVRPSSFDAGRFPKLFETVHRRLERVQIECLPYEEVLSRYDRPSTLFYMDPPYWGRALYRFNFAEGDFTQLERHLHSLKGKFVLSLNDVPEVRKLFRAFLIQPIDLAYSAPRGSGRRYREVVITNYSPEQLSAASIPQKKFA